LRALATDPRPVGCKKLKGKREFLWRIRVGDYRVIYDIQDKIRVVEIREVGDRKDIYR
jgi:mRNA interferase RelE/StbE